MELGLLYEFDCPQPWAHEHPWGQRTAERAAYKENIEQIVLADKIGLRGGLAGRAPLPREPQPHALERGRARRAQPDHRADQARLRRRPDAARIHPPGARRRKSRDGRLAVARPGDLGHGPLDPDGTARLRRRHRRIEAEAAGRGEDRRRHVGTGILRGTLRNSSTSPSAWSRPSPISTRTRRPGWPLRPQARRRWRAKTAAACCASRSCSRSARSRK